MYHFVVCHLSVLKYVLSLVRRSKEKVIEQEDEHNWKRNNGLMLDLQCPSQSHCLKIIMTTLSNVGNQVTPSV